MLFCAAMAWISADEETRIGELDGFLVVSCPLMLCDVSHSIETEFLVLTAHCHLGRLHVVLQCCVTWTPWSQVRTASWDDSIATRSMLTLCMRLHAVEHVSRAPIHSETQ